jgi:hypothetical protein
LKEGAKDTVNIVFNSEIAAATPPVVTRSPTSWANIGAPVAYDNGDKIANNSFYVPVEATNVGTGNVTLTVKDAVSAKGHPMVSSTTTVATDNTPPQATYKWSAPFVGRGQSSTLTLTFNEAMSLATKDSVFVTISGQGIDDVVNQKLALASNGLSASVIYLYKDSSSPTDVTSGSLTIAYGGGKDAAGNALNIASIAGGDLITDVSALDATTFAEITPAPTAPTVNLSADPLDPYDLGTQIKWSFDVSGPGSTSGTLFYLILKDGVVPPSNFQRYLDVQGVKVFNGFDLTGITPASNIVAQGNIPATSGSTGTVFTAFTPNGDFDVYAYWVSSTGNASPVSAKIADIKMQ